MARIVLLEDQPIRITAAGRWLHGEQELHPRVAALFTRHLVPVNGSYQIHIGMQRVPIVVDDTAYFVLSAIPNTDRKDQLQSVDLVVSDGAREPLDPATLALSGDSVLYCRITRRAQSVPCRFTPRAYYALAMRTTLQGDRAHIEINHTQWPIALMAS